MGGSSSRELMVGHRKPIKHDSTVRNCSIEGQASEDPPPKRFARFTLIFYAWAGLGRFDIQPVLAERDVDGDGDTQVERGFHFLTHQLDE